MTMNMIELKKLSSENLMRIQRVFDILAKELEIHEIKEGGNTVKIPLGRFKQEGLEYKDVSAIFNKIGADDAGIEVIDLRNDEIYTISPDTFLDDYTLGAFGFTVPKKELDDILLLRVWDVEKIKHMSSLLITTLKEKGVEINDREKLNVRKPQVYISEAKGIFENLQSGKPNYPVSGRRSKIIYELRNAKQSGPALAERFSITLQDLSKDINEINKNFTGILKLENKLITSVDTGGYQLNNRAYFIEFTD